MGGDLLALAPGSLRQVGARAVGTPAPGSPLQSAACWQVTGQLRKAQRHRDPAYLCGLRSGVGGRASAQKKEQAGPSLRREARPLHTAHRTGRGRCGPGRVSIGAERI